MVTPVYAQLQPSSTQSQTITDAGPPLAVGWERLARIFRFAFGKLGYRMRVL